MPGQADILDLRVRARSDFRLWAVLAVGLLFFAVSLVTDPATNCAEGGDCAPWLVPLAGIFGGIVALAAGVSLFRNVERGSRFDRQTGELLWWQNRTGRSAGHAGSIALDRIAEIRIDRSGDSDALRLIDVDGHPVPGFNEEAVPAPMRDWAEALARQSPKIRITELS